MLNVFLENVIVGLSAAGFVGVVAILTKKIKDKFLEKKFPIAGEYLTEFEDEEDHMSVRRTAPAILKQRGKKIFGLTYLDDSGREWALEGELSSGGHLYGIYYATDPHDKGIGNFFLYINYDRSLEGLWSGYDSANMKVNSGKYSFTPVIKNYNIQDLDHRYIPSIVSMSDFQLGKDYLNQNILEKLIIKEGKNFARIAIKNKKIMGFCLSSIVSIDEFKSIVRVQPEMVPYALNFAKNIGIIKILVVDKKLNRRGIGTSLIKDTVNILDKNDVSVICSIGWRSKTGINIGGILENNNFKNVLEMEEYWKEDSLDKNYKCADCGDPPCNCSAVFYLKT